MSAVLSRTAFGASAAAICKRAETELAAIKAKSTSVAEIVRVVPEHALIERKAARELRNLVPPARIARDWALIVAYRRSLADELAQLAIAARRKDTAKIKALSVSKSRVHRRLSQTAKRAGLAVCGQV